MSKFSLIGALASMLLSGSTAVVLAQEDVEGERKVRIELTKTENGETTHITKEFDLNDEQALEEALRELGVMDELRLGKGENMVIDMRHLGDAGSLLRDISLAFTEARVEMEARAYLGVYASDCDQPCGDKKKDQQSGAQVNNVIEGDPAHKAGLREGDVITSIGDVKIESYGAMVDELARRKPGEEVVVGYTRDKKKISTKVVLGAQEMDVYSYYDSEDGSDGTEWMEAPDEPQPFLGVVGGESMGSDVEGARISSVVGGSSAEAMGIHAGDIIRKINDEDIDNYGELVETIAELDPGDPVEVKLLRNGVQMVLGGTMGQQESASWYGAGASPYAQEMPPMPCLPAMPLMPPMPERLSPEGRAQYERDLEQHSRDVEQYRIDVEEHTRDLVEAERDRAEFQRDMAEMRREMDQLRRELRGGVTREMTVTIGSVELSKEDMDVLNSKGVNGLDKKLDLPGMRCYPNPSGGFFRLEFQAPVRADLNVDVRDAKGERVYHETITGFKGSYERTLDLSDLADGTYFLVITQNGSSTAQKLLKQ